VARVLVTGGAGYIGSILVPALLRDGHSVTVVDRFIHEQPSLLDVMVEPELEVIRGDARDADLMARVVPGHDVLIPLAALVGAPLCANDPEAACSTNVGAVELLLSLRAPDQRVIYPNTNSGYGIGSGDDFCTEETPLRPVSLYGRTKCQAEEAVLRAGNSITFRLATVFGTSPRMRLDLLVNDFTYRAVTDGFVVLFEAHFKRNYIHVRDVARAFLHAITHFDEMRDRPYNVGLSDANLSKRELCERIRQFVPAFCVVEAPIGEDPDKRDYVVSNARIEAVGFQPCHSLDDGIRELLKAYQVVRRTQFANA
jgi:nucleoside-diphosphate-sugar epimerase